MTHWKTIALLICALQGKAADPTTPTEADGATKPETKEVMVVTATKHERPLEETPAGVSVMNRQRLEEMAIVTPGEELRGTPGVFMRRDGAGSGALSINIRGLTGVHGNDTFLALLDGIPFVSAHEEVLLSEVPVGAVERVEVVRGPVSALYGRGALSGAVNYITRSPDGPTATTLSVRGGSFGYVHPHLSTVQAIGNHRLLIDGYSERRDGKRDHTEREVNNLLVKDEIVLSPSARLTAYLNAHESNQEAGGQIPLDAQGNVLEVAGGRFGFIGYEPNAYDRQSIMTALRHNWLPNDQLTLTTTLHYRNIRDNNVLNFYDPSGFDPDNNILRVNGFENDRDTDVLFFEPRLTWSSERHNLTAGLNWEQVDLKETDWWTGQNGFDFDTFDYYFYQINIDYTTGRIINRDHPYWIDRNETYRGDSTNTFAAVFLQDEWSMDDRTTVTLGLRYDTFDRNAQIDSDVDFDGVIDTNPALSDKESYLSPKLAVHHRFSEAVQAYLSYGHGFNANFGAVWQWDPGLYERGNEVKPSVVKNTEVGLKGSGPLFRYSASLFNMVQNDRLVFISNPDGFGPPKASTAHEFESSGLELETAFKLSEHWSSRFGFTYIDAQWNDYAVGGNDYTGNRPGGVPESMWSFGLRGRLTENLRLWGEFQSYGDYAVTLNNDVIVGGYDLLDLGLAWQLPIYNGEIQILGKNLLDDHYYHYFGSQSPTNATPGLPAHLMLNLNFRFGE